MPQMLHQVVNNAHAQAEPTSTMQAAVACLRVEPHEHRLARSSQRALRLVVEEIAVDNGLRDPVAAVHVSLRTTPQKGDRAHFVQACSIAFARVTRSMRNSVQWQHAHASSVGAGCITSAEYTVRVISFDRRANAGMRRHLPYSDHPGTRRPWLIYWTQIR